MFGQQVLTKLLSWKESPNFPLQDPNFGFFISLLVMKIFCFENKSHEGQIFQSTAIFSKDNIRKNGKKNEKCQNFKNIFFRQFKRCDDMSMFG